MYGDMSSGIGASLHHRWVSKDVSTNHEMGSGGGSVVGLEEIV